MGVSERGEAKGRRGNHISYLYFCEFASQTKPDRQLPDADWGGGIVARSLNQLEMKTNDNCQVFADYPAALTSLTHYSWLTSMMSHLDENQMIIAILNMTDSVTEEREWWHASFSVPWKVMRPISSGLLCPSTYCVADMIPSRHLGEC
jgi:hypothetical protein